MLLYVDIHDSKSASEMTYIVSGGTLNSLTHDSKRSLYCMSPLSRSETDTVRSNHN